MAAKIGAMSETASSPESATGPVETPATTAPVVVRDRGGRLNVVAAWVGIVAGSVFVVAVIFFSGFVLGASVTGGHHHGEGQMERDGGGPRHGWPGGPGGPGGPGFPGGPGWDGPGQGPGSPPPTPPGR